MHLLTVHRHKGRGGDAEADLVSLHRHDGDVDVAIDHDLFTKPAGQDQHRVLSWLFNMQKTPVFQR
jgi:hypothetical protein